MKKLVTAFVAIGFVSVGFVSPASAVTPPDSCFAFNANTITDYYDNEGNNWANPACPKDVDIPSTIGGQPVNVIGNNAFSMNALTAVTIPNGVTSIGDWAFAGNQLVLVIIPSSVTSIGEVAFFDNQLTSITIPNTVTSIGSSAFSYNRLTSVSYPNSTTSMGTGVFANNQLTFVTIPDGVTSIGGWTFSGNRLTSVILPDSVTSTGFGAFAMQNQWGGDLDYGNNGAPDIWSSDPNIVQAAYDSIWYARLYTVDPSNPNNLVNAIFDEDYWWGMDANINGSNDSLGGHLINPASLDLSYVNQADANLQTTNTFVGQLNSTYLNNYYSTQGPIAPNVVDLESLTPLEQQAIDDALSVYYRIGDEVTITPPAIAGYNTPPTQTFVLGAATNEYSYVYAAQSSDASSGGELAQTGMNMAHITGFAIIAMTIGIASWLKTKQARGIKL